MLVNVPNESFDEVIQFFALVWLQAGMKIRSSAVTGTNWSPE
jgi:hypothetical protein